MQSSVNCSISSSSLVTTSRMHCLNWFIVSTALLSLASAAQVRLRVEEAPSNVQRGYQEQDTANKFYSYGYSDENAARAEYTTLDGSSRGFYSYVDANGKLQTVKYEAGGAQGFKAEASNQPKAPVDDKQAPLPVQDTAEVQQARQEHLEAIRVAEQEQQADREEEQQRLQVSERGLSSEDAAILERVRAELTSMLAQRQRGESSRTASAPLQAHQEGAVREAAREAAREASREAAVREAAREAAAREAALREATAREAALQAAAAQREKARAEEQEQAREQARERAQERAAELQLQRERDQQAKDLGLRTVYTVEDLSSKSYLKLSNLQARLDGNTQTDQLPIGSYYSYESPSAKYSVTTPTELRPLALSRSLLLSKRN